MALEKHLSTQTAILLAGASIAVAVFLGLRGRDSASPPSAAPAGTAVTGVPPSVTAPAVTESAPPRPAAPPQPGSLSPEAQKAVEAAAQKSLDAQRAAIIEKCLKPSVAKNPDPPHVKYSFDVAFGPDGKQIARGLSEYREAQRTDVAICISNTLGPLEIPPPGVNAHANPQWVLP
ncbi:MAG: hypothetical protein U0441_15785 [Polyangiaceae bacterium]